MNSMKTKYEQSGCRRLCGLSVFAITVMALVAMVGCASSGVKTPADGAVAPEGGAGEIDISTGAAPIARGPAPESIELVFKGKKGERSQTRYYSNSHTLNFSDGQLTHDHVEIVDFTVSSSMVAAGEKTIETKVKTIEKDGIVDLHELAFPELGEEISYVLRPNGEVLRAGRYPPHSIFFVPSLPIATKPLAVGDTWPMEYTWISSRDRIPLKLQVIGILKGIVPCDLSGYCADVEISGNVALVIEPVKTDVHFSSRVWGRVLFALDRGDVLWSEMRSREEMVVNNERTQVESCMISGMKLPRSAFLFDRKFECDSKEQPVGQAPSL